MNRFGIKVYGDSVFEIDGVHYNVNSIKYSTFSYFTFKCDEYKFRVINVSVYGIRLRITNKKK